MHTPKTLVDNTKNAAIVYAHGGGVISGSADLYKPLLSEIAEKSGVVCFNVDYRLSPETKCPNNVLDFYCAIKYVVENAKDLGIDPEKIAIAGER